MARCEICGTEMVQGRGRARRTCSAKCRQAAYRRNRAAEVEALRAQARDTGPAESSRNEPAPAPHPVAVPDPGPLPEPVASAWLGLVEVMGLAARRMGQDWAEYEITPRIPATTAEDVAHAIRCRAGKLADAVTAHAARTESSRNEPAESAATAGPVLRPAGKSPAYEPAPAVASRDEPKAARRPRPATAARAGSAPAEPATGKAVGIKPEPQRLARKRAQAVIDAAELVRDPEHRDNHRWILRSGDTVLGYVEPSYGGTSRSGRNGWVGRLAGLTGPRGATRDAAAVDLAMRWMRLVTAAPKRTITGSN
ncbi:hypothetical protein LK08_23760 [Streptomyces sp. MUSC 125]|nr:hypothetical protein LK08_23760 [Streptomyces sp. MUSC 125]